MTLAFVDRPGRAPVVMPGFGRTAALNSPFAVTELTLPATSTARQHRRRRPGTRFRPDIEGLRAIAVLAVVFYHANVGFLSGGFVGVDVFYVISGFLITQLLWREVDSRGRLSFAGFYARRARRILPAAMLVLVVTMIVSLRVLPPLQMRSVWKDGLYSALYVGNYRFAATKTDYLAASTPSPFQHYWSLGVEEQFYLVWPLLLVIVSLAWWWRRPSRLTALSTLSLFSAGSLLLSLWLTHANEPVAFFSLPTRAWELGLGGLIALGSHELRHIPGVVAAALGWAGLTAILVACVVFGASTPYPGTAALLPVLGAGAVVVSGLAHPAGGPVLVLGRVVMRAIGRISYSWYLWHYPVLILAPFAVGHVLAEWQDVGLALLSGLLAVVTFRFVENPFRHSSWLSARPRRGLATGVALSGVGVTVCVICAAAIPSVAGHGEAPVAVIHAPPTPSVTGLRAGSAAARSPSKPATVSPTLAALYSAQSQVEATVARSAAVNVVPANLDPPLSDASASEATPMVDGCLLSFTDTYQPPCLFGDTTATRSIILFGDSHAAMWFPAVDAYANANGYRLYVWTKATCPPVDISFFSPALDRTFTECTEWRDNAVAQMAAMRPALVVLGIAPNYDSAYDVVENGPAWLNGLAQIISAIRGDGSRVLVMGSVPSPPDNIPDCLSANLNQVSACDFSRAGHRISGGGLDGVDLAGDAAEEATVRNAGAWYVEVAPWFCTSTACLAVVDNLLVYWDNSHITVSYATYLAPLVGDEMAGALTGSASAA
jgi:peptidoglycan/LPS O-acetylase OafA/YrhL